MSTLLLEDALKPATPLTNGAINETHSISISYQFLKHPWYLPRVKNNNNKLRIREQ